MMTVSSPAGHVVLEEQNGELSWIMSGSEIEIIEEKPNSVRVIMINEDGTAHVGTIHSDAIYNR